MHKADEVHTLAQLPLFAALVSVLALCASCFSVASAQAVPPANQDPNTLANCVVLTDTMALCMNTYGQHDLAEEIQIKYESIYDALLDQVSYQEAARLKDEATANLMSLDINICDAITDMQDELAVCTDLLTILSPEVDQKSSREILSWRRSAPSMFF